MHSLLLSSPVFLAQKISPLESSATAMVCCSTNQYYGSETEYTKQYKTLRGMRIAIVNLSDLRPKIERACSLIYIPTEMCTKLE